MNRPLSSCMGILVATSAVLFPLVRVVGGKAGELAQALQSRQASTRAEAAREISKLGPSALPELPALRAALADSDASVRYWAARAQSHSRRRGFDNRTTCNFSTLPLFHFKSALTQSALRVNLK